MNVTRRLRALCACLRRPRFLSRTDSNHNNSYANISKQAEDEPDPKEDWACLYLPSPAITRHPAFQRIQGRRLPDSAIFRTRPTERKERKSSPLAIVSNASDDADIRSIERKEHKPSSRAIVRHISDDPDTHYFERKDSKPSSLATPIDISIMAEARQRAPLPMKGTVTVEIPRAVLCLAKACAAFRRVGKMKAAGRFQIYITALGTGPRWQDPAVDVALRVAPEELPPCADNVWKRAENDIKFARACLRKVIEIVSIEERGCLSLLEADWDRFEAGGFDKEDVWDT